MGTLACTPAKRNAGSADNKCQHDGLCHVDRMVYRPTGGYTDSCRRGWNSTGCRHWPVCLAGRIGLAGSDGVVCWRSLQRISSGPVSWQQSAALRQNLHFPLISPLQHYCTGSCIARQTALVLSANTGAHPGCCMHSIAPTLVSQATDTPIDRACR